MGFPLGVGVIVPVSSLFVFTWLVEKECIFRYLYFVRKMTGFKKNLKASEPCINRAPTQSVSQGRKQLKPILGGKIGCKDKSTS